MKILFTTSTIPASDTDPVPAFVKDEAIWFKKQHPSLEISILAPHSAHSNTKQHASHKYYDEYRFHYFWPFNQEKLTGKGIQPALKNNKWLYFQLPGLFIAEFFATLKYTRKLKPDVIYAHWFTPQAITTALVSVITGVPFVFDTQASDAIVLKRVPLSKKLVVSICKRAEAYTVPSQQTLDKLLYFTNPTNKNEVTKKLTMVSYGTSPVHASEKAKAAVIKKYGLKSKKVIYFIGRLVDRKGVDILIKSFANLSANDPSLRLVIVGDGQMKDKLVTLTERLKLTNSIIFTGFLTGESRHALLSISDVCVIPSINVGDQSEGLPVVFMEALSFNKITVVSDATGAHEVVTEGENSFVVTSGSVDELTLGMKKALLVAIEGDKKIYHEIDKLAKKFQWPYIAKIRFNALFSNIDNEQ